MIKMFINDEEVVSNKELVIKEEMLATPSAILNNCYPKSWEDIKDYVSKFYYPRDYSRCIIGQGSFEHGTNRYAKLNASGIFPTFETNTEKPFDKIEIDGKSTQTTSTDPVSPSPDYPSEVECIKGKNLFDKNNITSGKLISINDGSLVNNASYGASDYIFVKKDTVYHQQNTNAYYSCFYDINKNFIKQINAYSFTPSEDGYMRTSFLLKNLDIVQIEKGAVATDYLPYNTIQVKNIGKNIWNEKWENGYYNRTTGAKGTSSHYIRSADYIPIEPNTTIYFNKPNDFIDYAVLFYDSDLTKLGGTVPTYTISKEFISPANANYFTFYGDTGINDAIYQNNIIITKGSTPSTYEPYQENTLNIDLQGNELCSLPNNIKDELVIENGRAKIIKRVGKTIFNGDDSIVWNMSTSSTTNLKAFWILKQAYPKLNSKTNSYDKLSNYFAYKKEDWRNVTFPCLCENANLTSNMFIFSGFSDITSVNEFKTWLSTHNTIVYYELETPTEIDLGEVETLSTFEGINNVSLDANMQTNMNLTYLWENYGLLFCGIVKNSGNISLNPRYPHFGSFQILDFKTFLSESDTLDFVISNKTITEAIEMVIDAISTYGFVIGNIKIFGADDIIGAYSTQNKTAYDVFQYIAEITGSRWFTRLIDEKTIAIDFYDPTLMERGDNLEYNEKYFEDNYVVDLSFSYGSRDYRNKQVILSDEIYASIDYTEIILSNGYQTVFNTENNIGIIKSIYIDNIERTFATNNEKETGIDAEFYYTPGKSSFESDGSTYPAGTQITITYTPLVRGRQVVYNNDEVARIYAQTGRKGVIARYESRNDILSSKELDKVGQSYIKYKGSPEVILTLTTEDKDLYNIGQIVYFDSPIPDLAQDYMVKSKQTKIIMIDEISQKIFFIYELTSSFNAEKEINYFDNQRNKNKGNISVGETITRNIDIENTANIIFKDMTISEVSATGNNILNSALNSPFVE